MKTAPTDDELAAIAAALLRCAALRSPAIVVEDSRWRENARREGVTSNVPRAWRE